MLNMEPMLCKLLKDELKFKVIFIAKTKEDVKYFTQHYNDSFNKIIYNEKGIDVTNKKNLVNFENIEKIALKYEKKYDRSIYRLFFIDRVIGRGFFASGGVRHPRNRTHQMSKHTDILNMAVNEIIYWETIFKENNVKLALNLPYHAHIISQK